MNKFTAVVVPLLLAIAPQAAQAQSISEGWTRYRAKQTQATAAPAQPAAATQAGASPAPMQAPAQATQYAQAPATQWSAPAKREEPRGGFFVGVQGGAGWVIEDVDQRVIAANAGYRWQAGEFTQVGIEVATGRLQDTEWQGFEVPSLRFSSVGANARFSFGPDSAWFGVVRGGYWYAESDDWFGDGGNIDGGYTGVGIGVDINRHFNLQLMYTAYLYSNPYYYYDDSDRVNRADVLTLGGEVRF